MNLLRLLLSLAASCQVAGAICMVAAAFAKAGHVSTANLIGFSGIGVGIVLGIGSFVWLGRAFD